MATYNIYGMDATDESEPEIVVTLNDDDTQIVSAVSGDAEGDEEIASIIETYQEAGLSAKEILPRLAGTYGVVEEARPDSVSAAVEEDEEVEAETETETEGPDEPVEGESTAPPLEVEGTMAMTNDAGIVVTLLQKDAESGSVYRHGNEWVPVTNPSVFDGLTFVGVEDDSVETYDRYESDGMLAPISEYTSSPDGPFWPDLIVNDDDLTLDEETGIYETASAAPAESEDVEEEPVTASVTLNTADDLTAAIAAAVEDPDLRWYVQRRVEALGLEASLPWLQD